MNNRLEIDPDCRSRWTGTPVPYLAGLALVLWCGACTEANPTFVDPAGANPCAEGEVVIETFDLAMPSAVDILFVVDNSPGSGEVQEALALAMPGFVNALNATNGLDFQLGITTTDIVRSDQQGRLQRGIDGQPGCPGDRPLIITPTTSGGPQVAACNVVLGEDGDDYPAGLEATRFALLGPSTEPGGENEGFMRADAHLVTIVVSSRDDCSDGGDLARTTPNECVWDRTDLINLDVYSGGAGFFDLIKPNAGSPVDVAFVTGPDDGNDFQSPNPPQPVCASNGPAFGAQRYEATAENLGDDGGTYNICSRGYQQLLLELVENHIVPGHESLCPFLALTQEPVSVRIRDSTGDNVLPLPNDGSGYLYLGASATCANGEILIAPDRHGVLGVDERLEVHYCTSDSIP